MWQERAKEEALRRSGRGGRRGGARGAAGGRSVFPYGHTVLEGVVVVSPTPTTVRGEAAA